MSSPRASSIEQLHSLVEQNRLGEIVKVVADTKSKGNTNRFFLSHVEKCLQEALATAVFNGHSDIVEFLLKTGARTNVLTALRSKGRRDVPVLTKAAYDKNSVICDLLVQHGADIPNALGFAIDKFLQVTFVSPTIANRQRTSLLDKTKEAKDDLDAFKIEQSTIQKNIAKMTDEAEKQECTRYADRFYGQAKLAEKTSALADCEKSLADFELEMKDENENISKNLESSNAFLKMLMDHAIGKDFEKYELEKALKNCDLSNVNFLGVSLNGIPITHELLAEHKSLNGDSAIVTLTDLNHLADEPRRATLMKRLAAVVTERGELITAQGAINLIPLHKAAEIGDLASVTARLEAKGSNPNERDKCNDFAIVKAVEKGHLSIVKKLAEHPAIDPVAMNLAFKAAQENKQTSLVEYLSAKRDVNLVDKEGKTLLHHAIIAGNVAAVRELIAKKADVNLPTKNGQTPLQLAANNDRPSVFGYSSKNHIEILNILLANGANPKSNSCAALITAAFRGNIEMVQILFARTQPIVQICSEVLFGLMPYWRHGNFLELLAWLKTQGVRFDMQHEYQSTLIHAVILDFSAYDILEEDMPNLLNVMRFLADNNSDPLVLTRDGGTPAMWFDKKLSGKDIKPSLMEIVQSIRDCLNVKKVLPISLHPSSDEERVSESKRLGC